MMYTSVTRGEEVERHIFSFTSRLKNVLEHVITGEVSVTYGCDIIEMCVLDIVRIIRDIPIETKNDLIIRNVILSAVIQAETLSAGAGFISALHICNTLHKARSIDRLKNINKILSSLSRDTRLSSSKEIFSIMENITSDKISLNVLKESIKISGSSGKIFVDIGPKNHSVIEQKKGYHFPIQPDTVFSRAKFREWSRTNVKCLVVDGIVEKMSEIEKMIYQLRELKAPALIFARGYSEEVSSTLSVNFIRGYLDIIPCVIPIDETGINMMNDVAVVLKTDVVSSLKGELISQKNVEDMSVAEEASFIHGNIVIRTNNSQERIRRHVKMIKEKKKDSIGVGDSKNDLSELLDKRIMSLTGDGVKISLGRSLGEKRGIILDRTQTLIRMFKDISIHGIVRIGHDDVFGSFSSFRNLTQFFSARAFFVGMRMGDDITSHILNMGAIITED